MFLIGLFVYSAFLEDALVTRETRELSRETIGAPGAIPTLTMETERDETQRTETAGGL